MRTEKVELSYDEGAPGIAPTCCLPVKEQSGPNGHARRAAFPPLRVRAADTQGGTVTRTATRATDLG
ncbi:hypothetical protein AB0A81_37925 [Streptomyces flaveolus]|uniref:Uncharacterized protein n=1 Tax=Streptomyces flaveolus TaxID=67297 RepID=A0ABV1VTV4_9ACTN